MLLSLTGIPVIPRLRSLSEPVNTELGSLALSLQPGVYSEERDSSELKGQTVRGHRGDIGLPGKKLETRVQSPHISSPSTPPVLLCV